MRGSRAMRLLAVAATVFAIAAACGDDGGSSDEAAAPADPTDETAAATPQYYVSLGDSYASGFQPEHDGESAGNSRNGFAYLVPDLAAELGWDLELVNFGCGGATTTSILESPGCAPAALGPDGEVYEGVSQADAAVEFLEEHQGEVALLTVSIGGNDVTSCASAADPIPCVGTAVDGIHANLGELLPRLREAAGPDTLIVGLTYPDVILGGYVSDDPTAQQLAQLSVVAFEELINPALAEEYEAIDGIFVDVTAATGAYGSLEETTVYEPYGEIPVPVAEVCELTWYCELQDIHPKDAGYSAIAELVVDELPAPG